MDQATLNHLIQDIREIAQGTAPLTCYAILVAGLGIGLLIKGLRAWRRACK